MVKQVKWFEDFAEKVPPRWKVQREWRRLKSQSTRGIRNLYEPFVQRYHDANFAQRVVIHPGTQGTTARVAVLLIWQHAELPGSLKLTIEMLRQAGFCTVVVSNSPLLPETLHVLTQSTSAVLERPNFGYDFGGYRDGIRFVFEAIPTPDTLLLLNDSTWLPLRSGTSTLQELLRDPAPYKGLVNKQFVYKPKHRKHLESHFLMFERPVLCNAAFHEFWKNYRVSSDRYNTLRGEYGISDAVASAGFPMTGLIDPYKFMSGIEALSPLELRDVLANVVTVNDARKAEVSAALQEHSNSEDWRARASAMIRDQIWKEEHLVTTAYIYFGLRYLDFPYLKKRREPLISVTRLKALEMIDQGIIPPLDPDVEAEVRASI
jgi:hypothetical protein